jgi:hypothetical protein
LASAPNAIRRARPSSVRSVDEIEPAGFQSDSEQRSWRTIDPGSWGAIGREPV